jgi:hypothetical protein
MAYTDATAVAAYLGITLTSGQATQAGVLAAAATAWIDRYTGRSWQTTSPVTDELHEVIGDAIYLNRRPVAAITTVETRQPVVGATYSTLSATEYELIDAANGVLRISGWGNYEAAVTYTHTATSAPADVALAACMIAAAWLSQTLRPSTNGLESISVGQNDVSVKFSASRSDVPAEALTILRAYRAVVIA